MGIMVDAKTEREVRRLAELRGVTVEQALNAAVRAELARLERPAGATLTPEQQAKVERTMAMVAALPRLPGSDGDPTAFLYDDRGLPR